MIDFEDWAEGADESIERQLGARYLSERTIGADSAIWEHVANRVVATPDDDGFHVVLKFRVGGDERLMLTNPSLDGALIAGWLAGKH
jgi:hypothetical protein